MRKLLVMDGLELPAKWIICGCCGGEGKSSAYLGSWTSSEWAEEDWEFKESYLAGGYDRPCEECKGDGKVLVVDEEAEMTAEQKAVWEEHLRVLEAEAENAAERRAEQRAMGYYD